MQGIRSQALTEIVAAKVSIEKSIEATQMDAMREAKDDDTSLHANDEQHSKLDHIIQEIEGMSAYCNVRIFFFNFFFQCFPFPFVQLESFERDRNPSLL